MTEILCTLCQAHQATAEFRICAECAVTSGLRPFPPPSRPPIPCVRCDSTRFIRVLPREYTADGSDYVHQKSAPMTLTQDPNVSDRLLMQGRNVETPDVLTHGHGHVETYVCAKCGFIEWYCQDPQSIPVGPEYNSELVDFGGQPYR